ncbi:unnamed protein product, partial [Discosporangium mesarthrocarpum]
DVRRRRLEKFEAMQRQQQQTKEKQEGPAPMEVDTPPPPPCPTAAAAASSAAKVTSATLTVPTPRLNSATLPPPPPTPDTSASNPSVSATAMPSPNHKAPMAASKRSAPAASPTASPAASGGAGFGEGLNMLQRAGTGSRISPEQRLSNTLRAVFRVSLKDGAGDGYTYVGDAVDGGDSTMNKDNLQEILCARLGAQDVQDPKLTGIGYLVACFRRCQEEMQTARGKVAKAGKAGKLDVSIIIDGLEEAHNQIVNFSTTCLMEPGIFGEPGADSPAQLLGMLLAPDPAQGLPLGYLPLLLSQLEKQEGLDTVLSPLLMQLTGKLKACRSAGDMGEWMPPVRALRDICKACKPACTLMAKLPRFMLPQPGTPEAAPFRASLMELGVGANVNDPFIMDMVAPLRRGTLMDPRSGSQVERNTVLGHVFKIGFPPEDPIVRESFDNPLRRTQNDVNSKTLALSSQLRTLHGAVLDLINVMLKASPQCRKAVTAWFADAVLVNTSAEAFHPDPIKTSTPAFLLNVNLALLRLAMPIVSDPAKMKKIDASAFLSSQLASRAIFPQGTTMLTPPPSNQNHTLGTTPTSSGSREEGAGGQGTGSGAAG